MSLRHTARKLLWNFGLDLCKFEPELHPIARRRMFLTSLGTDLVLDVGANAGQFAQQLRVDTEYRGRIVSFEPLKSAFELLAASADADPLWEVNHCALGGEDGSGEINVAGNSFSSSLLDMLPRHEESAPQSKYVGRESITIKRLDSVFEDIADANSRVYLKIDTQGFEDRVISGAENSLARIDAIQMELSLEPLYAGEVTFTDMCSRLRGLGYQLVSVESGFMDPKTGQVLQVDGVFQRR
ncbi:MAG: FkbM family methyltransferase [Limisphaerales bacterium]|jgi:FkbM family methyltransferase